MKSTIVKMSELNNRWDAAYHIGLEDLPSKEVLDSVKNKIKESSVVDLLNKLPVDFLKDALHVFETGSRGFAVDKEATIKKYPYEIYAHVIKNKNKEIIDFMKVKVDEISFIVDAVTAGSDMMDKKKKKFKKS